MAPLLHEFKLLEKRIKIQEMLWNEMNLIIMVLVVIMVMVCKWNKHV